MPTVPTFPGYGRIHEIYYKSVLNRVNVNNDDKLWEAIEELTRYYNGDIHSEDCFESMANFGWMVGHTLNNNTNMRCFIIRDSGSNVIYSFFANTEDEIIHTLKFLCIH